MKQLLLKSLTFFVSKLRYMKTVQWGLKMKDRLTRIALFKIFLSRDIITESAEDSVSGLPSNQSQH